MRRISFLLFSIALIASGMIIWQFVSFMMDVSELLDWLASFEVR
jgi:hypothetical protein